MYNSNIKPLSTLLIKFLFIGILVNAVISCKDSSKKPESESQKSENDAWITISSQRLAQINTSFADAKKQVLKPKIFTTGKVVLLPNNNAILSANIQGKIEKIYVTKGQHVNKGEPMFKINSMELIELQKDYNSSKNEAEYLGFEYKRQVELRKKNIGSLADFQLIEHKYKTSQSTFAALKGKLKLLGIDPLKIASSTEVNNSFDVVAPISGTVFKLDAVVGKHIDDNTELGEIINTNEMIAEIAVFEKDLNILSLHKDVSIEFINQSIAKIKGTIKNISNAINPEKKSVDVFINFKIPANTIILPDMSVRVEIEGNQTNIPTLTVPSAALIQEEEFFYVYVAKPAQNGYAFKKVKVKTGLSNGESTEIISTPEITENTKVVITNVYMLNAEYQKLMAK